MEPAMKTHDVQSVSLSTPSERAFTFIAAPSNLPRWTSAFATADTETALMRTPAGEVAIALQTLSNRETGTIDWVMRFPDGAVGVAYSRVTADGADKCVYSFVLMAPPVPLEALEGALDMQSRTLAEELLRLKTILEAQ